MNVLQLENVRKTYQKHVAVNNVSFNVPEGSIFGLLGPNGAGKTSLIRIITTITRADSGTIHLNGEKLHSRHPEVIGYMPEERGLYKKMKVGEHLIYLARLKGLSKTDAKTKINHWLEKFEITSWWDKKVEELSKGMQQKIQFISTIVHEPKLLILDEPFSGLDPINSNLMKDEIAALRENGASIIFSTHRMEQVEEICEKIVLINQGQNVLEGDVKDIKNQFKENIFEITFDGTIPDSLGGIATIIREKRDSITLKLQPERHSNEVLQLFLANGNYIHSFREVLPTLNEIFIKQVNN